MLMDVDPKLSWADLVALANDRDTWKCAVHKLKAESKATAWIKSAEKVKQ